MKFPQSDTFIRPLTVLTFCNLCPFCGINTANVQQPQSGAKPKLRGHAICWSYSLSGLTDSQQARWMGLVAEAVMGSLGWWYSTERRRGAYRAGWHPPFVQVLWPQWRTRGSPRESAPEQHHRFNVSAIMTDTNMNWSWVNKTLWQVGQAFIFRRRWKRAMTLTQKIVYCM